MNQVMDLNFIVRITHIVFASLAFIVLLLRAYPIFIEKNWPQNSTTSNKILVATQHSSYSIVVLSGGWLLWSNQFVVQPWFYAKIILFLVILSASVKAFKRQPDILIVQRQAGVVIATIAFCAVFGLSLLQPQFG